MGWIAVAAVGIMFIAFGFMAWAAGRGMSESKFDGWTPADALLPSKPRSKDSRGNDA